MSRNLDGVTPVLQRPIISLKTGPRPMTCADNLMLSWDEFPFVEANEEESIVVVVLIGLELVCSALTKARAVFRRSKNKSFWKARCIEVPCSRSLWVCSTNSLVFLGIFSLSVACSSPKSGKKDSRAEDRRKFH